MTVSKAESVKQTEAVEDFAKKPKGDFFFRLFLFCGGT